ncbi:MAG: ATP-binding protein, partial [Clostridia bacterium]|nr:ATP-binding protein [Clostridia bacterium]
LLKDDSLGKNRELVEDIRNSSNNLLAIINDILDISKIESGKLELIESEFSLSDVLKDTYLIVETLAVKHGLELSFEVDSDLPRDLYGDPVRIRGLLVNLLTNAIKYTKSGSVTLCAKALEYTGERVSVSFDVIDTGIGIKEEDLSKLFTSFSRFDTKQNANIEGTGLGLALVKGYAELMGGEVSCKSVYGAGSTFTLVVPLKVTSNELIGEFSVERHESTPSKIGTVKFPGVKVLAVDDNHVNLKVISKILAVYNMDVDTCDEGPLSILKCREKEYDVILMDQMMPEMDGIEAMHEIRKISPHYEMGGKCKIAALTANAISGSKEYLLYEGFDGYLSKPIVFSELEEFLK